MSRCLNLCVRAFYIVLKYIWMTQCSTWCLPIKYSPPEWVSTRGHPGGTWHSAASSRRHSWLCTDEQHRGGWQIKRDKYIFGGINVFFFVGNHVASVNAYSTFIQLSADGFHQRRHGGGRACDVGGARVNHSCAALRAEHHLHPHWNAAGSQEGWENETHTHSPK